MIHQPGSFFELRGKAQLPSSTFRNLLALGGALLVCVACGGGGGGSSTPAAPATSPAAANFQLRAAYDSYASTAVSTSYTVGGTCSGTAVITETAPAPTTFENTAALAATRTINFSNCGAINNSTRTVYFDSATAQIGFSIQGGEFGISQAPLVFPAEVAAGDSGTIGTFNVWTDSTQATPAGTLVVSYTVSSDSSDMNAVTVVIKKQSYSTGNVLTASESYQYSLSSSGTLTAGPITFAVAGVVLTPQ